MNEGCWIENGEYWVELTEMEMEVCCLVGGKRNDKALRRGYRNTAGQKDRAKYGDNIEGVGGEMSVCKLRNIYYGMVVSDIKAPDAGPYQVRTNCSREWDDMNLRPATDSNHPGDELKKNHIWISVCSFAPRFRIDGWAWGHEVMQDKETCKWFRLGDPNRPKAWWYKRQMLHSMDELPSVRQTLELMRQRELVPT